MVKGLQGLELVPSALDLERDVPRANHAIVVH